MTSKAQTDDEVSVEHGTTAVPNTVQMAEGSRRGYRNASMAKPLVRLYISRTVWYLDMLTRPTSEGC
eukprot:COSAG03_NODE_22155_length_294_cov_1.861538_1_plen_66_part_01